VAKPEVDKSVGKADDDWSSWQATCKRQTPSPRFPRRKMNNETFQTHRSADHELRGGRSSASHGKQLALELLDGRVLLFHRPRELQVLLLNLLRRSRSLLAAVLERLGKALCAPLGLLNLFLERLVLDHHSSMRSSRQRQISQTSP